MSDFLYTIVLLGSVQGTIICGILLFSHGRQLSTRLLAWIIGLVALPGFHLYFHYNGGYELNLFTQVVHDILPMVVIMPLGPLIYFYVMTLTGQALPAGRKRWLHFLPVIIDLLPKLFGIVFYLCLWAGYPLGSHDHYAMLDDWYSRYADIPRWLSVSGYLLVAMHYLRNITRQHSLALKKSTPWIRTFLGLWIAFQFIWLCYLIPYVLPAYSDRLLALVDWFPLYIPMSVLVYWLGIQGYMVGLKHTVPKTEEELKKLAAGWKLLKKIIEEQKLYLDPKLNLDGLAQRTELSARQLSTLLNQHGSTNFSGFVNYYRVEEFKSRLGNGDLGKLTIAGLAMECGFSSPATFQRIFKQFTGMSPSAFLKSAARLN